MKEQRCRNCLWWNYNNKQNTEKRSNDLVVERSGGLTSRKYTSIERYFSNILTYVGSDFSGTGKNRNPNRIY